MGTPLVSVIVAAYNCESTILAALASVRDQQVADLEVIVVDAGSTDSTRDLVRDCASQDDRIRLVDGLGRLNPPQARNAALRYASGTFVAGLDCDDLMVPDRLVAQVSALVDDPSLAAIGGHLAHIDESGLSLEEAPLDPDRMATTPVRARYAMPLSCPCSTSALTIRASALHAAGGFLEDHPLADDYALIWQLMKLGGVALLPRTVGRYRIHPAQASTTGRPSQLLEVAAHRRMIAEEVLGRPVAWSSILGWTKFVIDDQARHTAIRDWTEYDAAFRRRFMPDANDTRWIDRVFGTRLAILAEPAHA